MASDEREGGYKRTGIGKKRRFEILKRDGFRCVYCGRGSPAAILVIDHIQAVAEGGGNEPWNLVSCCEDCNQGKGKRPLGLSERFAHLPKRCWPAVFWKSGTGEDEALYIPRNVEFPEAMSAEQRHELIQYLWECQPDGKPFRFLQMTVELHAGTPPLEKWADPENRIL
jgi:hypothetical protein